jgi:chaperone required for assembly of F1-ATPase
VVVRLQSENWDCLQQQKQQQQGCELLSVCCSHVIMHKQQSELTMQILSEMSSQVMSRMLPVLCEVNKNLCVQIV